MIAQPPQPQAAFQSASLYVGDLHQEVTEVLLVLLLIEYIYILMHCILIISIYR